MNSLQTETIERLVRRVARGLARSSADLGVTDEQLERFYPLLRRQVSHAIQELPLRARYGPHAAPALERVAERERAAEVLSHAMALKQTGHGSRNPKKLNKLGKDHGCFSGDLVISSCLASAAGAAYSTISVDSVWGKIAAGIPVTAYGYSSCMGGYHAQMIWGHDGRRYITKDPWYDWTNQDQNLCMDSGVTYRVMR